MDNPEVVQRLHNTRTLQCNYRADKVLLDLHDDEMDGVDMWC